MGSGESPLHVAAAQPLAHQHVAFAVQYGRAGFHGFHRIVDRRQLLVLDLDETQSLKGGFGCLGRHRCDRVSDVAHAVVGKHRLVLHDGPHTVIGDVDGRNHCRHAGCRRCLRGVNAQDAGVGIAAAQKPRVQHARNPEILGEAHLAGNLMDRVVARNTLADGALSLLRLGQGLDGHHRPPCSLSAASITASIIFI